MSNREVDSAWSYHEGTKHSLWSIHTDPHYLDFDNQPLPFKIYTGLEAMPLPDDSPRSEVPALSAVSSDIGVPEGDCVPDLEVLASILYHSAGVTRRRTFAGGEMVFRAAACTGALYHIELYLVCCDLPGLEAGVYHFGPRDFALRRLRRGDHRGTLARATGNEAAVAQAPAVLVCTGTYWRNAWKYRARTYRHCFWDNGTILANMLSIANAHKVPSKIVAGFVDHTVNHLLGLDTQREVALSLVPLGRTAQPPPDPHPEEPPIAFPTVPLSKTEVDYPAIGAMHEASCLSDEEEAAQWHGATPLANTAGPSGKLFPLNPLGDDEIPGDTAERVMVRRGSSRQFVHSPIGFRQLSTMLHRATRGVPADFLGPEGPTLNDLYLIVNAVEGLPSGSYIYHREADALEQLQEGDHRGMAGHLGLQQPLPADASVNVFMLADLGPVLERYGNRGYRAAQLEGAVIGGKLYLAAYAQRLGATGLTFFDDDVTAFFSPHAEGKSVMFLVALGVPLRRRMSGVERSL